MNVRKSQGATPIRDEIARLSARRALFVAIGVGVSVLFAVAFVEIGQIRGTNARAHLRARLNNLEQEFNKETGNNPLQFETPTTTGAPGTTTTTSVPTTLPPTVPRTTATLARRSPPTTATTTTTTATPTTSPPTRPAPPTTTTTRLLPCVTTPAPVGCP